MFPSITDVNQLNKSDEMLLNMEKIPTVMKSFPHGSAHTNNNQSC